MVFFFQAEDGIRDLVRSRGLGDVYKRQLYHGITGKRIGILELDVFVLLRQNGNHLICILYLSLIHI